MFSSDAQGQVTRNVLANINSITLDIMLDIQKELEPYDVVSMVFLLYDVPDTALQRLMTYQRICKDVENNNLNLIYEWALHAQAKDQPTWRYEFLEALTICRLYSVIRNLGFNVESVKEHYDPCNLHVSIYIHPVMKLLYRLCENITSETFIKLKDTLSSFYIDVTEHEYCEMVFLELICQKLIVISNPNKDRKTTKRTELEKLVMIIESYSDLQFYATQLREIEIKLNNDLTIPKMSTQNYPSTSKAKVDDASGEDKMYAEDLKEAIQLFHHMNIDNIPVKNLKSDTMQFNENLYPIYNPKRVGVCCIINQEKFHPSKNSINNVKHPNILSDRMGTKNDQLVLEKTMRDLNFVVKVGCNLKYTEIFEFIKKCVQFSNQEDSMFVLCILSHGVRDHIFSSDSLKVKVEDIQNMLDSNDALHLREKPKILILQACRVDETPEVPQPRLVADSGSSPFYLPKSHFLVYWATAPEFEAFRDENLGSIFVQTLCYVIRKKASSEQLSDICTLVTNYVTGFCTKKKCIQVPIFESSLRKKLYLSIPNHINSIAS